MTKLYQKTVLLGVLVLLAAGCTLSQESFEQQYRDGIRIYRAGLDRDAYRHFREMNKEYPDSIQVLHMLGRIDFQREWWKKAAEWFENILEIDERNLDAHYYSGICHREMGKFKAFVLRKRDWNRAEEYFRFVLDSLDYYKDLYLQFAILQKYNKNYAEAIQLAETQLSYQESTKGIVMLHQFYSSFIHNRGLAVFQEWAAGHQSPRAVLYLGEALRLKNMFAAADSIYKTLLRDSTLTISPVPIYIAFSKSKIEQKQLDSCQFYFDRALESINNSTDAQLLFENVKYVFSDEEYEQYKKLENTLMRREFLRRMWVQRNPMPASEVNYRLVEHVRRFAYAERNYYYDGFRLQFNNPDRLNILQFPSVFDLNNEFNDKGLVYIRHGEPDDRAFMVHPGPLNESWLYYPRGRLNKKMIFHFWQGDTQSGQNWRFVPSIPAYLAESRSSFDHLYSRMMTADPLEAISIQHQMEIATREDIKIGMNTDQHQWPRRLRPIYFPFYVSTYRESPNLTRSEIYFSLHKTDVLPKSAPFGLDDSVIVNFAVFDEYYGQVEKQVMSLSIREIIESAEKIGFWPGQINFVGNAGMYIFALNIRTPGDEGIGGYKFRFNTAEYEKDGLLLSGIELAHTIRQDGGSGPFSKHNLLVVPNPAKTFSRKENINIYFEVYNIPQTIGRQTRFMVNYQVRLLEERASGLFARIGQLFTKKQATIANEIERSTKDSTSFEYMALNLPKHVPGIYELKINVKLPGEEDGASRKINFELK